MTKKKQNKKWNKMTDREKQSEVEAWSGWTGHRQKHVSEADWPDFLNDTEDMNNVILNEHHSLFKHKKFAERLEANLTKVVLRDMDSHYRVKDGVSFVDLIVATARQKAEAYVITMEENHND